MIPTELEEKSKTLEIDRKKYERSSRIWGIGFFIFIILFISFPLLSQFLASIYSPIKDIPNLPLIAESAIFILFLIFLFKSPLPKSIKSEEEILIELNQIVKEIEDFKKSPQESKEDFKKSIEKHFLEIINIINRLEKNAITWSAIMIFKENIEKVSNSIRSRLLPYAQKMDATNTENLKEVCLALANYFYNENTESFRDLDNYLSKFEEGKYERKKILSNISERYAYIKGNHKTIISYVELFARTLICILFVAIIVYLITYFAGLKFIDWLQVIVLGGIGLMAVFKFPWK